MWLVLRGLGNPKKKQPVQVLFQYCFKCLQTNHQRSSRDPRLPKIDPIEDSQRDESQTSWQQTRELQQLNTPLHFFFVPPFLSLSLSCHTITQLVHVLDTQQTLSLSYHPADVSTWTQSFLVTKVGHTVTREDTGDTSEEDSQKGWRWNWKLMERTV